MKVQKTLFTTLVASLLITTNAQAFEVIKGEDLNDGGWNTHATLHKTKQAEKQFLNLLDNTVGTENFENVNWTNGSSLDLSFPGAAIATLGGNGQIYNINDANSNKDIRRALEQGQYPSSEMQYWHTKATPKDNSTFKIDFDEDIAAFGFYAYDIGDWGAELTLKLYSNGQLVDTIDDLHTIKNDGSTTGSAIYVGIVGELLSDGVYQTFDRVEFTTTGKGIVNSKSDSFSFDDMTIAKADQLRVAIAD